MNTDDHATGRLLWQVTTRWRTAVDRAVAPLNLTHAQYALLGSLYGLSSSGIRPSQRELADFAGLEPIYVSKLVRQLQTADLIERTDHPDDPRAWQLAITDRGAETFRQAMTIVHALQDELTAPIGGTASARNRELIATLRILLSQNPNQNKE